MPGNNPQVPARRGQPGKRTPAGDPCETGSLTTPTTSNCWSGYVEQGTTYYSVSAQWNVPSVAQQPSNWFADATWIGVGGWGTDGLLQAGTEEESQNGALYYYVWDENLPGQATEQYRFSVSPGDHISARIWLSGNSMWTISVVDETTGQADTQTEAYTGSTASADFIQEAPSSAGDVLPMDPYQQFGFYNADANYSWSGLNSSQQVTMTGVSVPSAPNPAASSFNMEYGGSAPAPVDFEAAFQGSNSDLWTTGTQGSGDQGYPDVMASGTSPGITTLAGGGYEVAFQGSNSDLWTTGTQGLTNWGLGMMSGTSPGIAAVSGGYEAAFQANTGYLYTAGTLGTTNWGYQLMPGTSPSITAVPGGVEIAFQDTSGDLETVGNAGNANWGLGMMSDTSPSITAVPGGFETAFQASTGALYTVGNGGNYSWGPENMMSGTSPSITTVPGGFQATFQATSGYLWTYLWTGSSSGNAWQLGMKAGTSPAGTALP